MDYVDRDKILRKMQKLATVAWQMKLKANVETVWNDAMDVIRFTPSADAAPVVHAKWEKIDSNTRVCSACGFGFDIGCSPILVIANYCPSCGAKLDGAIEME